MKKSILLIAFALSVTSAFAQDLTSKKGEPLLPEAGDWAIALDASPFFYYAGSMLSNNGATAPPALWTNSDAQTIVGKLFKDEKTAYRAMVRLGFGNDKEIRMIGDATANATFPGSSTMVQDVRKISSHFIGLGAGMEMRKGKSRLQGFYGADAMIWLNGRKTTYEYGNALADTVDVDGNSTDFEDGNQNISIDVSTYDSRATEVKSPAVFGLGIRGFVGVEYFIFSKMSIGAEYGWGVDISSTGTGERTEEAVDNTGTVGSWKVETGKNSAWSIDTDINKWWGNAGNLFLILHF